MRPVHDPCKFLVEVHEWSSTVISPQPFKVSLNQLITWYVNLVTPQSSRLGFPLLHKQARDSKFSSTSNFNVCFLVNFNKECICQNKQEQSDPSHSTYIVKREQLHSWFLSKVHFLFKNQNAVQTINLLAQLQRNYI